MEFSMKKTGFALGLMSGTSVDAIDASLVKIGEKEDSLTLHVQFPYEKSLQENILAIIRTPEMPLARFTDLHYSIGKAFADAAENTIQIALKKKLLKKRQDLLVIGAHGQTVFHDPDKKQTLQIGEGAKIAALTGITTVSDFRSADTAYGGEGAPLLPIYHHRLFAKEATKGLAVHNLGGISNYTYIGPKGQIFALDTGPANCFLDGAIQTLSGGKIRYDARGARAKEGVVQKEVAKFFATQAAIEKFRQKSAPKSTGRELFSPRVLEALMRAVPKISEADLLCSLTQYTVDLIAESYRREIFAQKRPLKKVVLAGGGSQNDFLIALLRKEFPSVKFVTMEDQGWSAQALESQAFAYFAHCALQRKPITLPSTTGAKKPVVCGKISYPS
jgi:anhydro-N-acetylmuramic acid kinase